jgi:IS5 family transposase
MQMEFYQTPLESIIDIDHELVQLTHKISWDPVVQDLAGYFSEPSRSEVSLRKVAGLLILKNLYNLSDEQVLAQWRKNVLERLSFLLGGFCTYSETYR